MSLFVFHTQRTDGSYLGDVEWPRLSEQIFRLDKWNLCQVKLPSGRAAVGSRLDPVSYRQGSNVVSGHCRS
jgi:hypothetical protein